MSVINCVSSQHNDYRYKNMRIHEHSKCTQVYKPLNINNVGLHRFAGASIRTCDCVCGFY